MDSSEKLIELGNSWYTAKTIEVERQTPESCEIADESTQFKTGNHSEGTALEKKGSISFCFLNWKYRTMNSYGSQIICDKVVNQKGNSPDQ